METTAADAAPVLPAVSIALAVKLWLPVARLAAFIAPGAAAVGRRRPDLGRAVEHLHRAVRLGGAGAIHATIAMLDGGSRSSALFGAAVSIVTASAADAVLVWPDAVVRIRSKVWLPSEQPQGGCSSRRRCVGRHGAEQRCTVDRSSRCR